MMKLIDKNKKKKKFNEPKKKRAQTQVWLGQPNAPRLKKA